MNLKSCECEHACHFRKDEDEIPYLSPNGKPGHEYAAEFNSETMEVLKTPYGTFFVCVDCSKDCLHDFKGNS